MQQITAKSVKELRQLGGEGDAQGIVQEIEIWTHQQVVYAQHRIHPGEWKEQSALGFSWFSLVWFMEYEPLSVI